MKSIFFAQGQVESVLSMDSEECMYSFIWEVGNRECFELS